MYPTLIFILSSGALCSLGAAAYFFYKDMGEQDEIMSRFNDLEAATKGYCKGELNGAYSRIQKRQKHKKNNNERQTKTRTP